jgi:DNA-binding IclR family transcriptional regulator
VADNTRQQRTTNGSGGPEPSASGRSESGRSVVTIERAADVLFLFAEHDQPTLGVTEISKALGISKAVVHRILSSLRERDLVVADLESRRYALGPAVLGLAAAYRERLDIRMLALETMHRLSDATQETATLSIRNGDARVYVDQVNPDREVRMTVQVGRPFPLHAGSSSKAFLANLPEAERESYLERSALDPLTSNTITDVAVLRRELDQIRAQGFAVSMGERQADAASVASPILDSDGPVAVISVCGPIERFRDAVAENAGLVVEATRELSSRLGHREHD